MEHFFDLRVAYEDGRHAGMTRRDEDGAIEGMRRDLRRVRGHGAYRPGTPTHALDRMHDRRIRQRGRLEGRGPCIRAYMLQEARRHRAHMGHVHGARQHVGMSLEVRELRLEIEGRVVDEQGQRRLASEPATRVCDGRMRLFHGCRDGCHIDESVIAAERGVQARRGQGAPRRRTFLT